jgi:hypothetical protein
MSPPADRRARGYQGAISAHTDAQAVAACTLAADQDHFRQDARPRRSRHPDLLCGLPLQPFACDQRGSLAGRPPAFRTRRRDMASSRKTEAGRTCSSTSLQLRRRATQASLRVRELATSSLRAATARRRRKICVWAEADDIPLHRWGWLGG